MAGFSIDLSQKLLDAAFGGTAYTPVVTHFVRIYTVMPIADGTGGTEATGGGYAALSVTNNGTNWTASTAASPAVKKNATAFTWPAATGDWSANTDLVGYAIWSLASGGVMLDFGTFDFARRIRLNDIMNLPIASVTITLG